MSPDARDSESGEALWGGRFSEGMAPEMVPLNLSLDVDRRLWREDVRGSRAWAQALGKAGALTEVEVEALLKGLEAVAARLEAEGVGDAPEEDIHSLVERMLREAAGEVAGKLHTGRSRNDQSSTGVRLFGINAAEDVEAELLRLKSVVAVRNINDEQVASGDVIDLAMETFTAMKPFLSYLDEFD